MDLLEEIRNAKNEEEIKIIIDGIITELTKSSIIMNEGNTVIGAVLDYNPHYHFLKSSDELITQGYNGYYLGFIPKGTKLVYGVCTNTDCFSQFSQGYYYYLDDFSYIYEFAKYIKDKKVNDEFDIISYVYKFLRKYFDNYFNPKDRTSIHSLLLKDETSYFKPIKEHSNKDFVHNGSALCSEFSSAANNLLNLFGIDTVYLQDTDHAYNIVCIPNKDDEEVLDYYLFDTTLRIFSYNLDNNNYTLEAYIEYIPDFDEEKLYELLRGNIKVSVPDYILVHNKDHYIRLYTKVYREYKIERDYYFDIDGLKLKLLKDKTNNK